MADRFPIPFPTPLCPRPGDCFYCRWYTRCPFHAGEPMDFTGHAMAQLQRDLPPSRAGEPLPAEAEQDST